MLLNHDNLQKKGIKSWKRARSKGKNHYIYIEGGVKGGISFTLFFNFLMMIIDNHLNLEYFTSTHFWIYIIFYLIVFSIGMALQNLWRWNIYDKKYQELVANNSSELIEEDNLLKEDQKKIQKFNMKAFSISFLCLFLIFIGKILYSNTAMPFSSWLVMILGGAFVGALSGLFYKW